jgi:hypothetical protein
MTALVRLGGEWKTISAAKVFASGAWRTLAAIRVFSGGEWREVANFTAPPTTDPTPTPTGLSLSISPSPVLAAGSSSMVTSSTVTATPSGGLAPYRYAWSATGDHSINISARTSASTTFSATGILASDPGAEGTATCTATDALGNTATAEVALSFTRI